jgi:pimeloyl-ACP methyl ester carboxylesterase
LIVEDVKRPEGREDQPAATWRDPSPHQQRFVVVEPGVRVEVLDWGGSGRPVVFHSCYLTGHAYDEIAPKLTDRFQVYAFTRRGIGASDRPSGGYDLQRSVDDFLAVLDALKLQKPILVANSCGGWTQTLLAAQHPDRLGGVVYLDAADDPMLTLADYHFPPFDEASMPKRVESQALDYSSFDAYRRTQKTRAGIAFPEAELRHMFGVKPNGSLGPTLLSPVVRDAITRDARPKPDWARIRVPLLAVFRTSRPFEEIAPNYIIQNDVQRETLRQRNQVEDIMAARWASDVRAGVPAATIVMLPGASLYMFLSNEGDVIRELRAFSAALPAIGK